MASPKHKQFTRIRKLFFNRNGILGLTDMTDLKTR